jgi:hypothetical protein
MIFGFNFMRMSNGRFVSTVPLLGIFSAAIAVLGLVVAGERSGLPVLWAEWFVRVVFCLMLAGAIWFGRTAVEPVFFGRNATRSWHGGGLVLGMVLVSSARLVPGAGQPDFWLSGLLGSLTGLFLAHLILRSQPKDRDETISLVSGSLASKAIAPEAIASGKPTSKSRFASGYRIGMPLLLGFAFCLLGFAFALGSMRYAATDFDAVFGTSSSKAMGYALATILGCVALGGARGALATTGLMTLTAACGILASTLIGLSVFGPLPLPGFDNPQTLQAIFSLKQDWSTQDLSTQRAGLAGGGLIGGGLAGSLFFKEWPHLFSISGLPAFSNLGSLPTFVFASLTSAAIAFILSPAIQVRRRSVVSMGAACIVLVSLLIIAIGGYALEAGAEQFVGAPIARPPPALLEATRLGLLSVCNGSPETVEALRFQCGINPRDTAVLEIAKLAPKTAFLTSGLPVALGFTSAISLSLRLFPFAIAVIGVVVGLWIFALGLGHYVLGRQRQAPGLASFRIAVTRIAAVIGALFLALMFALEVPLPSDLAGMAGGLGALVIVTAQCIALRPSMATPRKTAQAA